MVYPFPRKLCKIYGVKILLRGHKTSSFHDCNKIICKVDYSFLTKLNLFDILSSGISTKNNLYCAQRIMVKYTSCHVFRYDQLRSHISKNYFLNSFCALCLLLFFRLFSHSIFCSFCPKYRTPGANANYSTP